MRRKARVINTLQRTSMSWHVAPRHLAERLSRCDAADPPPAHAMRRRGGGEGARSARRGAWKLSPAPRPSIVVE